MIEFEHVSVTYAGSDGPAVRDVCLRVEEGELALVVGRTGVGKSTLLGAVNGLVPHFTGGTLAGRVTVDGRDTRTHRPRELADVVGVVGQDPLSGFVTDTVEEELAYVMEQLAVPPEVMRKRVEETLDLLGIADLRDRPLVELSGGQQQRVAIGSVLTSQPKVLVLDEPTSALDPNAAEEVLAAITRLVHDLGVTVVLAEHRLERVVQYADRIIEIRADGTVADGPPAVMLQATEVAPPVVELGRLCRWEPLPLSVRDARRVVAPLRDRLTTLPVPSQPRTVARRTGSTLLRSRNVVVRYGAVVAVRGVDLDLVAGEVTALMGRNGSGKSSLLWALQGSGPRQSGTVDVGGVDPGALSPAKARSLVGLVPQTPADLLYLDRWTRSATRPTGSRPAGRPARPGRCSTSSRPASRPGPIRGTSPKASGSPSSWPSNSRPRRTSSCSMSPPVGSTTRPSGPSPPSSTGSWPVAARWSCPPTTSNSRRPPPTGWW